MLLGAAVGWAKLRDLAGPAEEIRQCAAALSAVLEALDKRFGPEERRSKDDCACVAGDCRSGSLLSNTWTKHVR